MNIFESVLKDKVAVVTGSGWVIGKTIPIAYAKADASIVCAARTEIEIEELVKEITESGGKAMAVKTDVTCKEAINSMFEKAGEYFGGIDILVINAGVNYDRETVENSNLENWKRTLDVNLFGAYYCAYSAIPFLKQRGAGKIITIGSGLGHHGYAEGSAYSCSKAGLWMLTRILAQELLQYKISVNELIPDPASWDDYLWPFLVLNNEKLFTLTVGLAKYAFKPYFIDYGEVIAGSVASTVPVIVICSIFPKNIVKGISMTGMKG